MKTPKFIFLIHATGDPNTISQENHRLGQFVSHVLDIKFVEIFRNFSSHYFENFEFGIIE